MKRVDLFGTGLLSLQAQADAQTRTNLFYHIVQDGDKNKIILRYMPGLTILVTLPQAPIRGWYQKGSFLYVAAGNGLYQVSPNGGYTILGYFGSQSNTNPVSLTTNEEQLMLVDSFNGYVFPYGTVQMLTMSLIAGYLVDIDILKTITAATGNLT